MPLSNLLARGHGVASWHQLQQAGVTRTDLRHALRSGGLRLIRRGWYATSWADPRVVEAIRRDGVLSCVSALRLHGVWVPGTSQTVHVRARRSAHETRSLGEFCRQYGRAEPEVFAVDDVQIAFRHAVRCLDEEGAVVVGDSLLNLGLMTGAGIEQQLNTAPLRIRRLAERMDGKAQSGTESMARLRLRSRGVALVIQPHIPEVGWVDMLIGNRLIFEVDGYEHHADPARFESDRERDRKAVEQGYLVVRASFRQVTQRWQAVEDTIMTLIRRREHRRRLPGRAVPVRT